jgi:hypothetical protein
MEKAFIIIIVVIRSIIIIVIIIIIGTSRKHGSIHPLLHTPSWRSAYVVKHTDNFALYYYYYTVVQTVQKRTAALLLFMGHCLLTAIDSC